MKCYNRCISLKRRILQVSTLRFKGDHLEDEKGRIVTIPFKNLEDACLNNSYNSLSITEIVIEAVTSITGMPCLKNKCRESSLFNNLEESIRLDERYIQRKEEVQKWREITKKAQEAEKQRDFKYYVSDVREKIRRAKHLHWSY